VQPSDAELIAQALVADDPRAFTRIVERHQSPIRALLRRLTRGDENLADELAQDTFLQAYRRLSDFRSEARFSTWLFRIAYNTFLAHVRKQRDHEIFDENLHAGTTDSRVAASDLSHDLEFAMQRLSIPERAVLTLCLGEGHTHEETAEALNLPLGSVKTHLLRGREKLRILLAEWEKR
jgi:RNA polymerase sigma factor (sigma-70 family)